MLFIGIVLNKLTKQANDCPAHEYINGVVSVTKKGCV